MIRVFSVPQFVIGAKHERFSLVLEFVRQAWCHAVIRWEWRDHGFPHDKWGRRVVGCTVWNALIGFQRVVGTENLCSGELGTHHAIVQRIVTMSRFGDFFREHRKPVVQSGQESVVAEDFQTKRGLGETHTRKRQTDAVIEVVVRAQDDEFAVGTIFPVLHAFLGEVANSAAAIDDEDVTVGGFDLGAGCLTAVHRGSGSADGLKELRQVFFVQLPAEQIADGEWAVAESLFREGANTLQTIPGNKVCVFTDLCGVREILQTSLRTPERDSQGLYALAHTQLPHNQLINAFHSVVCWNLFARNQS